MNNPKWGTKRQCLECGAHFYDLKRSKIVCPKCDTPFKPEPPPKPRRAIATPAKAAPAPPPPPPPPQAEKKVEEVNGPEESAEDKALKEFNVELPAETSPDADEDEEEDENTFEDASELGEDKDNMAEVIDGSRKVDES